VKPVLCERCGATLRALPGIQQLGEPRIHTDEIGAYIRCPACGHVTRELSEARLSERASSDATGASGASGG
jgi:DNA-directed RNA polymerase subunit RPC12/RpoP